MRETPASSGPGWAVLAPVYGAGFVTAFGAHAVAANLGAGFAAAAAWPTPGGLAIAALAIGAGVAVATPVGFALLAASSPPERLGRTMGAGEVGRELGDAGGPMLVGALGNFGLTAGLVALAAVLAALGGLALPGPKAAPDTAVEPGQPRL